MLLNNKGFYEDEKSRAIPVSFSFTVSYIIIEICLQTNPYISTVTLLRNTGLSSDELGGLWLHGKCDRDVR